MTVATLVDRLKINGSLARQCLKDLEEKGQIRPIVTHSKMKIFSTFRAARCRPKWLRGDIHYANTVFSHSPCRGWLRLNDLPLIFLDLLTIPP